MTKIIVEETIKIFKLKPGTPIKVIPRAPKETAHIGLVTENNQTSLTYIIYDGFKGKPKSYTIQSKDHGGLYHIEIANFTN